MILNFASILSGVVLALPMTSVLANPIPSTPGETAELEKRVNPPRPKTHCVTVGAQGNLKYDPEYVNANVGDYIEFEFIPKIHTVTESSFDYPCNRIEGGFDTKLTMRSVHEKQKLRFLVTDTRSRWFYNGEHCTAGMVFAVNPPKKGNTFSKFKARAEEFGENEKGFREKSSIAT